MNFLWLSISVCLLATGLASQEIMQEKRGRRLCGTFLADALALVCDGAYNLQFGKRDGEDNGLEQPFISRQSANSLLQRDDYYRRFWRQTSGVVDECCYKSCDFYTLRSYCATKKA